MKTLTIFTPTFNRAYCLHKCYESFLGQTLKDFIWLIIDDGSTDNTKELVDTWIEEDKISIQYIFQENQGMHGAHNTAYELINTPLNVCIDSDDHMPPNAVADILSTWPIIKDNDHYAGIVGLDADIEGNIIGTKLPVHIKEATLYDLYHKHKIKGDKKLVYKTQVAKKFPAYPLYQGERFVPLGYLYQLIDQEYSLYPINKVFCIVEYQVDGSSLNMLKQYRRHPNGFAFSRKSRMKLGKNFKDIFKNTIHYVSCALFTKNWRFINESPRQILTILAIPLGILLNLYIRIKTRKGI